jgi:hypothetical protein
MIISSRIVVTTCRSGITGRTVTVFMDMESVFAFAQAVEFTLNTHAIAFLLESNGSGYISVISGMNNGHCFSEISCRFRCFLFLFHFLLSTSYSEKE